MTVARMFTTQSAVFLAAAAMFASSAFAQSHAPRAGPRPTQALHDEIAAQDQALFAAVFDTCDTAALAKLVTDDFEMYHDKGGQTSKSGAEFVKSIGGMCARQKSGEDYRARRELVAGSMKVYPLASYGAVEVGEHRFYQLLPGKPEKLVEIALFTHLWKREAAGWKLARVLSYDHRLTEAGAASSPYAGQQSRSIKALSPEEVAALQEGKGMGLAKAAELNGYPGPSHVLESARELGLTEEQRIRTERLFAKMQASAKATGLELLDAEARLEALFATRAVTPASLEEALGKIAALQAKLRGTHLAAHLEQVQILTREQIMRYSELRGYASSAGHAGHGSHR